MDNKDMSFEASIKRLDEIVKLLEKGDAPLSESLKLFEEGTELIGNCDKLLNEAEQKVVKLRKGIAHLAAADKELEPLRQARVGRAAYESYADFNDMMDLFEDLLSGAAMKILGTYKCTWQGCDIDLTPGWERLTMAEAVKEYAGIDFMALSPEEALEAVKAKGLEIEKGKESWGDLMSLCYDEYVEENLMQPTFITDYPVEISPLAKRKPSDPRLTERFECFVYGRELCNAFSELNDPIDQKGRFERQVALRAAGDEEAGMMDEDFINALEYGMPPTGGMGMGIDRLVMFLTDAASIRDVLLFPTMKPLD